MSGCGLIHSTCKWVFRAPLIVRKKTEEKLPRLHIYITVLFWYDDNDYERWRCGIESKFEYACMFFKKSPQHSRNCCSIGCVRKKKKIIISKESVRGKKDFWRMKANKKRPQTGPKKRHPIETQLLGMASMLYAVYFTSPLAILVTTKRPTTATILNT